LEIQFRSDLESIEREKQMPYVTSVERLAKAEGREEGREEGLLMGTIRTCQSVLGLETSSEAELQQKSFDELVMLAQELQAAIRTRFQSK
jgi:predicted transposase YdaD